MAFITTQEADVCRDSNMSWLRVVQRFQTTQKKMFPETPVSGRHIHCSDASRAEVNDVQLVEQKGVSNGTRFQTWVAKVQYRKKWFLVSVFSQWTQVVLLTILLSKLEPVGIASCRIFQISSFIFGRQFRFHTDFASWWLSHAQIEEYFLWQMQRLQRIPISPSELQTRHDTTRKSHLHQLDLVSARISSASSGNISCLFVMFQFPVPWEMRSGTERSL